MPYSLAEKQIEQLSNWIATYIAEQRAAFQGKAASIEGKHHRALQAFFPADVLNNVRVVRGRAPEPPFYPQLRARGPLAHCSARRPRLRIASHEFYLSRRPQRRTSPRSSPRTCLLIHTPVSQEVFPRRNHRSEIHEHMRPRIPASRGAYTAPHAPVHEKAAEA